MAEPEKPPMHALDSPLASNFLYGRPTIDRPPSSLAAGATARPIGYYYEDDDEYDMSSKTIFVGNDREPSGGTAKEPATQREYQERLRHMQQHTYRPGLNGNQEE